MKDSQTKQVEQPAKNEPTPVKGDAVAFAEWILKNGYKSAAHEPISWWHESDGMKTFAEVNWKTTAELYELFSPKAAPKGDDVISKEAILEGLNFHLNDPGRYSLFEGIISPAMEEYANQFKSAPQPEEQIQKLVRWAFREGWKDRARMQGVNKKALDRQYLERIRIIIANKHYKKVPSNEPNPDAVRRNEDAQSGEAGQQKEYYVPKEIRDRFSGSTDKND